MNNVWFSLALLAVIGSGCATPYQPAGFRGGYSEVRLSEEQYMVSVSGNAYTPEDTLWSYAQQRARELCTASGYAKWRLVNPNSRSVAFNTSDSYTITSPAPDRLRVQRDGFSGTKSMVRAIVVCSGDQSGGDVERLWEEELRNHPPRKLAED